VSFINDFTLSNTQYVAIKIKRNGVKSQDRFSSGAFLILLALLLKGSSIDLFAFQEKKEDEEW